MENTSSKKSTNFIVVSAAHEGQRLDNFLLRELKGVPKSHVYKLIRSGRVRVNSKRVQSNYRVVAKDVLFVPNRASPQSKKPFLSESLKRSLLERILFENCDLLIINKPAGMAVHGGSGISCGLIEALRQAKDEYHDLELVHRLDRDTSGCLILAKRRSVLRELHELLRSRQFTKCYLALVRGAWQGEQRIVTAALEKNRLAGGERIARVNDEGKEAATEFHLQQRFHSASLMRIVLHTGRMHQIRVHAAYLGRPVAGDEKYGDETFNRLMRKYGLRRMFLHAVQVEFRLPSSGQTINVVAPLDGDLQGVLARLSHNEAV